MLNQTASSVANPVNTDSTKQLSYNPPPAIDRTSHLKISHKDQPVLSLPESTAITERKCIKSPLCTAPSLETPESNTHTTPKNYQEPVELLTSMMSGLGPGNPASIRAPRPSLELSNPNQSKEQPTARGTKRKRTPSPSIIENPSHNKQPKWPSAAVKHYPSVIQSTETSLPASPNVVKSQALPSEHTVNAEELKSKLSKLQNCT